MTYRSRLLLFVLSLNLFTEPHVWALQDVDYQQRGDHFEGVRPKPVAGEDIELISALIDYDEGSSTLPERLHLKFFLKGTEPAFVTVREQDYKHYYWLDKVFPQSAWRPGFDNEFVWSTAAVLRQLDQHFPLEELGVLVRLKKEGPSEPEQVAPAILYHTKAPQAVNGYLFTLKTASDAKMSCSVYREGNDKAVVTQGFKRLLGGRPFTVQWDAQKAPEGAYNLQCAGYFFESNASVRQTVRFYHQPSVP